MTAILNVTPDAEENKEDVKQDAKAGAANEAPAADKGAPKPGRRVPPARTVEQPVDTTKWIRLVRGGTYGYKRAIYEQGKTYEVDAETAKHLLSQYYVLGNANETVEVYYFSEVEKKKK